MNADPEKQHNLDAAQAFGRHVPYHPRAVHQAFAYFARFFWLPCPLCGEHFGGHELRDIDGPPSCIPDPSEHSNMWVAICPICTAQGLGHLERLTAFSSPEPETTSNTTNQHSAPSGTASEQTSTLH